MVKKISTLALAALLAWPAAAGATSQADLEAQVEKLTKELGNLQKEMADLKQNTSDKVDSLNEKAEKWDEASRIQLSGDFRARLDDLSARSESAYTALDVARGVTDVLNAGTPTNINNLLGAFGMSTATPLANLAGALRVTPEANFIAAATGAGLTSKQANNLAAIFYNNSVGTMLNGMPAGTTVGDVTAYFGNTQSLVSFMKNIPAADRKAIFAGLTGMNNGLGYTPTAATDFKNDTMWTNRLRVNMRVKATEDIEFKGRLAMYKSWGMENNPVDSQLNAGNGGGPFMLNSLSFDGNSTRMPTDNALRVDRAFMNWNSIGGSPFWFSIGRRPTTDGPPAQFRMGVDERLATPVAYMDYPFDGLSIGYAYRSLFGIDDFPGRVRLCYGRGFEAGPQTDQQHSLEDVDFSGVSWDVYNKGHRYLNIESFGAFNMFNVPGGVTFVNPLEFALWEKDSTLYNPLNPSRNNILDRANLGNIYHTDAVYTDKINNLNYFLTGGWSHTKASGMDEMGTSLLGSWWQEPTDKDGFSVYTGVRYDFPDKPFKVGLEYNYGTKNWISFTPGNDDLYASKLATRGHVIEAYGIWNLPVGEAVSRFGKAFMRLGYQHYQYEYTGSGFWLGEPMKISDLASDPLAAQFYTPVDKMDQVYMTIEAWF